MRVWQRPGRCVNEGKRNGIGVDIMRQVSRREHGRNGLGERFRRHCGNECGFSGTTVAYDGDSNHPAIDGAEGAHHCRKTRNRRENLERCSYGKAVRRIAVCFWTIDGVT
ncbi:hypothetical protein VIGAN_08236100 [Vigna angularis var. angularis]|uniref:Uncharacterized protein n=1 Tax=Vigna angularis var. angularis TaxID=157739 RepID=A0A0S3SS22_PHAAN|nr:hypothetical protein VIGAN_08236100 [Vigna angularis var. angularis]